MAWSTKEIADLAGTTVNTVRHYHRIGLLDEPDRMSNGYKKYEVRHLVRLLQVRRLRDFGVPLDQMEQVGSSGDSSKTALHAIDADLAASIERLQRARAEIKAVLQGSTSTDVPSGFEGVASRMSTSERALILIYAQLYDDAAMADLRKMIESDDQDEMFDALPADADEETRRQLAERYAVTIWQHRLDYPWLSDPAEHLVKSPHITKETFSNAAAALFNRAQLDVISRAKAIADTLAANSSTTDPMNDQKEADDDS